MKKLIILIFVCASLCACHTTKTTLQTVERVHQDTLYLNKLEYDSIFINKEHYLDRSSDTVYIRDVSVQFKYKLLRDTIYKTCTDSIPVVKEVTVTQEVKYVPWYIKALAWIGGIILLVLILYLLFKLLKLFLK